MNCCRESLIGGGCPDPAPFLVTGPSGMSNRLCQRHIDILFQKWIFRAGFIVELNDTPESLGLLGFTLTKGSRSTRNLNGRKE